MFVRPTKLIPYKFFDVSFLGFLRFWKFLKVCKGFKVFEGVVKFSEV